MWPEDRDDQKITAKHSKYMIALPYYFVIPAPLSNKDIRVCNTCQFCNKGYPALY